MNESRESAVDSLREGTRNVDSARVGSCVGSCPVLGLGVSRGAPGRGLHNAHPLEPSSVIPSSPVLHCVLETCSPILHRGLKTLTTKPCSPGVVEADPVHSGLEVAAFRGASDDGQKCVLPLDVL